MTDYGRNMKIIYYNVNIRISDQQLNKIKAYAEDNRMNQSEMIRQMIDFYVE